MSSYPAMDIFAWRDHHRLETAISVNALLLSQQVVHSVDGTVVQNTAGCTVGSVVSRIPMRPKNKDNNA